MFTGSLHPYQVEDTAKMLARKKMLVAYGQGTGKTVMTLSATETLFDDRRVVEPGLIVALSGLKYQWGNAIDRFTCEECSGKYDDQDCLRFDHTHVPTSTWVVIDGTPEKRARQYAQARAWEFDYVLMSYEQVVNDWDDARTMPRGFMVLDEASFIRGPAARRAQAIKKLDSEYKYALTGTPMENGKPEEIYSIMQWVDPTVLGPPGLFDRTFIKRDANGRVLRYRNIPLFLDRLSSAMVRRTPEDPDVAPFMPDRLDQKPLLVSLDEQTAQVYRHVAQELLDDLLSAAGTMGTGFSLDAHYGGWGNGTSAADKMRGKIGQKILALQWLSDHPQLLRNSAQRHRDDKGGSAYAEQIYPLVESLFTSPKSDTTIHYLLSHLRGDPDAKAVVFTVYTDMVDILGKMLYLNGIGWRAFTGKHTAKQKQRNKVEFQTDPTVRVLVSSDAGGYGVDLPQANLLLNYDLPDKAGTADQRDTRIVRASSKFDEVAIRSVLVRGSLEERKYEALMQKRKIAGAFLDGRRINNRGGVDLDLQSMTQFLSERLADPLWPGPLWIPDSLA